MPTKTSQVNRLAMVNRLGFLCITRRARESPRSKVLRNPAARFSPRGFTLLELSVVMLLMALVAGLSVMSLSKSANRAALESSINTLRAADQTARQLARKNPENSVRLLIDRDKKTVSILGTDLVWKLQKTVEVLQTQTTNEGQSSASKCTIAYSGSGQSIDFAIQIGLRDTMHWIFIAGRSGQVVKLDRLSF